MTVSGMFLKIFRWEDLEAAALLQTMIMIVIHYGKILSYYDHIHPFCQEATDSGDNIPSLDGNCIAGFCRKKCRRFF